MNQVLRKEAIFSAFLVLILRITKIQINKPRMCARALATVSLQDVSSAKDQHLASDLTALAYASLANNIKIHHSLETRGDLLR